MIILIESYTYSNTLTATLPVFFQLAGNQIITEWINMIVFRSTVVNRNIWHSCKLHTISIVYVLT